MESISNGVEDYLIEGLSFKLAPGSSYVTDRRKSTFWASGSNIYTTTGTRVVRFLLNGEDGTWIDPSTIRIQYDLVNKETDVAKRVRPLGGPHLFFRRARLMVNSTLCEDIQDYNRFHEMMDSMRPDHVRDNIDNEGFGYRWDDQANKYDHEWARNTMPGIKGGGKQTVSFKPYLGLFNQSKLLPLKYAPLILEMEIVNQNIDPIISRGDGVFTAADIGINWNIENICVKCDCVTLDNNLNNEYTSHLLSGKALPIKYTTYINQQSSMGSSPHAVQVSRAVSRLQKAFITFYKNPVITTSALGVVSTTEALEDKPAIKFYHPMGHAGNGKVYDSTKELEIQMQLGPKLLPEYPCKSLSESFTILKQTLNLPDWGLHSVGIDYRQYLSNKFIFGMSFEKVPESSWTGTSTKSGQILLVKCSTADGSPIADQMYITLVSEQILEIRDVGVSVYD